MTRLDEWADDPQGRAGHQEGAEPLATPPSEPPAPTGEYEEPPVQPAQTPPPAFPDQPDPRDLDYVGQAPEEKEGGPRVSER